jgi:hypothetical protein
LIERLPFGDIMNYCFRGRWVNWKKATSFIRFWFLVYRFLFMDFLIRVFRVFRGSLPAVTE